MDWVYFTFKVSYSAFYILKQKEREQAQKLYKGKKLKTSEKPKTFVPGEQLDRLNINPGQNANFDQQRQIMNQRAQPTKEDIEAIKVAIYLWW